MINPTLEELLEKGKYNRYELVIAASKCARIITNEYVVQREKAEKMIANKETDKAIAAFINPEYRDERAVKIAIKQLYTKEYQIVESSRGQNLD